MRRRWTFAFVIVIPCPRTSPNKIWGFIGGKYCINVDYGGVRGASYSNDDPGNKVLVHRILKLLQSPSPAGNIDDYFFKLVDQDKHEESITSKTGRRHWASEKVASGDGHSESWKHTSRSQRHFSTLAFSRLVRLAGDVILGLAFVRP